MKPATSWRIPMLLWGLPLASLLLLQGWTRDLWAGYLLGGLGLAVAAAVVGRQHRGLLPARAALGFRAGLLLTAVGLLVGGVAHWRFELIEFRWDRLSAEREEKLARSTSQRLDNVREAGSNAAAAAAAAAADTAGHRQLFPLLAELRERTRVDALAVFADDGGPVAWAGEHRGAVPERVHERGRRFYFEERPLFSYLYFIQPVPGRAEHSVAAILVEAVFVGVGDGRRHALFQQPLDARVSFHSPHKSTAGRRIWSLEESADTVVQAVLRNISQAERRAEVERIPRRLSLLLALAAFVAFAAAYLAAPRPARGPRSAPLIALLPLLSLMPAGEVLGLSALFMPSLFVLPRDVTLGRALLLLGPLAALVAARRPRAVAAGWFRPAVLAGSVGVAFAYPAGLRLFIDAAGRSLLERGSGLWLGLQFASVLALAVLTALAIPRTRYRAGVAVPRYRRWLAPAGALLAVALALLVASFLPATRPVARYAALWCVPFALVALGTGTGFSRRAGLRRWFYAGWLAITAVVPHLRTAQVHARLQAAEDELRTLGTESNPYLRLALEEFGRQAGSRAYLGEEGIQLLYRTWVGSGLASEGYPVRIIEWSPDNRPVLQLGSYIEDLSPGDTLLLHSLLEEARVENAVGISSFTDQPHVRVVLTVPLATGDVITVVVPPRRTLGRPTGVALFFGAEQPTALRNLVPAVAPREQPGPPAWVHARGGWRAQALVRYPDGQYRAHLLVSLPGRGVWLARGAILLALDLALLLALWTLGSLFRGVAPLPRMTVVRAVGTFRARVTIALFAFFLIPTVSFGYAAYHALAQEVERATRVVAERAANQAVREFPSVDFDLRALAQHASSDVLLFQGGELVNVSSPEAFALGVYGAWLPPLAYAQLRNGEEAAVGAVQDFAGQQFVTAYHTVQPSGTLAIPMPLVSGDTAVRQRELADVIIFAAILGALLSLALSMAVARALAGPIARLRRAAAAVGAGRLRVHLPEEEGGEFGQLFTSFNRMVRRLRRARARELRTARVLAWGEMARQVAHEIKNPLTPIKLSVQHLKRAHQDRHPQFDAVLEGSVQEILREIDRLSEIARAFSRYGAPAVAAGPLEAVDLVGVVKEALTLYRAGDDAVAYTAAFEPGVSRVQARTGELKEVLLNLLENARTALPEQGRITVHARQREDIVELLVEDNGSGIAPELLGRVFEPHFSTRSSGTGLGLAIVRRLVESWQGSVSVDSRPGEGTTVTVRLRVAALPSPAPGHGTR
ncbi:MAG: HAMP domain-containing protein [Gemmatimonadetes bacterium]|nr:HAMP domain-containing protein [Gemmatimonadota bacterium]